MAGEVGRRVCVLTTSYPRGARDDAGVFVKRLVSALAEAGAAGSVITPLDRDEPLQEQQKGFTVERFRYGWFRKGSLAYGAGIVPNIRRRPSLLLQAPGLVLAMARRAMLKSDECDLVHANWSAAVMAAWINKLITGKPYVVTVRGEDLRLLKSPLARACLTLPLKQAAGIVSVNKGFLDLLEQGLKLPREKLRCIPNGVTRRSISEAHYKEFLQRTGLTAGEPYLLFVGTLIPRKRVHVLIELLAQPELQHFKLILCGRTDDSAYHERLVNQAKAAGCSDRIVFSGKVAPADVPCYLRLAAFYVSAAEFEGRPNAVLEAMAAGKVVFASDIEAHREVIVHGRTGFLFNPGDIAGLARLIADTAARPGLSGYVGDCAADFARGCSWEQTARQYLAFFDEVVPLKRDH